MVGKKTTSTKIASIRRNTGFSHKSLPTNYLGVPLYVGRTTDGLFDDIYTKIRRRILSWENKFLSIGGRLVLLRSILNSMPLYLLQVMQPPGKTIDRIEKLYNSFLWGSTKDGRSIHWRRWERLCYPMEEGGLGVRSTRDMVKVFAMKLWWKIRTQKTLWTDFIQGKYGKEVLPSLREARKGDSYVWKKLKQIQHEAEDKMVWAIGEGNISIWHDKWVNGKALREVYPEGVISDGKVHELLNQGRWNVDLVHSKFPSHIAQEIIEIRIQEDDSAFWVGNQEMGFSTKIAWQQVRERRSQNPIFKALWSSNIPLKISISAWRILLDLIPTDLIMRKFGFVLPSKCQCCEEEETSQHIFLHGDIARKVWQAFNKAFQMSNTIYNYIQELLVGWANGHDFITKGHIRNITPLVVLWSMWNSRNRAKHQNITITAEDIIQSVIRKICSMMGAKMITHKHFRGEAMFKGKLGDQCINQMKRQGQIITWVMPEPGWMKLNCDGCARGSPGPAAAGGLVRDHRGVTIASYCSNIGVQSALMAELQACRDGIVICKRMHIPQLWIESDSQVLCNILNSNAKGSWNTFKIIADIRANLSQLRWKLTHIRRQGNAAADFMANLGLLVDSPCIFQGVPNLQRIKGIVSWEARGLPNIRGVQ